jgi:mannan endo-1,4-beta-mannosidase
MSHKILAVCAAAVAIAVCTGAWTTNGGGLEKAAPSSSSSPSPTESPIYPCTLPSRSSHYVGLSVPGFPPDVSDLTALENKFQVQASAVSMYMSLGMKFDMSALSTLCAQGALPIIEIDSDGIAFRQITAGAYDAVLTSYAQELKALNYPVAIDFDHEFNYTNSHWGPKYHSAKDFVNAWRHIVTLFRKIGADQVMWIWNPATNGKGTVPIQPWYPGNAYVTWTGLDGYFTTPQSTFQTVFGPTLADLKTFTHLPVFIDETAANPASGRVRAIDSLFSGVERTPAIKGLVWFDYKKAAGRGWQIEDDPSALAAFRAGAERYLNG